MMFRARKDCSAIISGAFLFEGMAWVSCEWICLLLGLHPGDEENKAGMNKAVTYLRVSTDRQGQSGLGLEAQQRAVEQFAKVHHYEIVAEIVEVESGKKSNRPLLREALQLCAKERATLLIAKLDRLARNVAFIARLIEAGVDFKAIDNPFAGKLMLHIMAAFAEHERDQISERTAAAMNAAKLRGVQFGQFGRDVLSKRNKEASIQFAQALAPTITQIRQQGHMTVRDITAELNRQAIPTFRNNGQKWHLSTVHKLVCQIDAHPYSRPSMQALPDNLSPS